MHSSYRQTSALETLQELARQLEDAMRDLAAECGSDLRERTAAGDDREWLHREDDAATLAARAEEAFPEVVEEPGYVIVYRQWEEDEETKKKRERREIYYKVSEYVLPFPLTNSGQKPREDGKDLIDRLVGDYSQYTKEADGSYIRDIVVRKRPGYVLGYGVLGRTWPSLKVVEIREGLYGKEFAEVLLHELTHIENPYDSEYVVRVKTRQKLLMRGDQPVFHN